MKKILKINLVAKAETEPVQARVIQTKEEPKQAQEDDSKLSAEEKNFKKRYGDLRRHQQKKKSLLQR